ncbi:MAG: ABC transporter substrate-binding protein [Elusimicrobia bacterium]|nr:ABC transporter substrate-binding protein [Elusimicrobiota bacterium]
MSVLLAFVAAAALAAEPTVLRVCDDIADPPSLNPYRVFSEKTHVILQQLLEGLVRFGPDGDIVPALAERWERVDELRMRFHLRPGVRFHNGEALDAAAVKFSLERYVDPGVRFVGYGFVKTIAGVDVVDERTVDVRTHGPDGLLLNRLAAWIHVVPPAYFAQAGDDGFAQRPVGTGPFRFARWERGRRLVLEANRSYWREGTPKVDVLSLEFIPAERQVDALLSGEVDVLTSLPGTRTLDVQRATATYVIKKPSFYTIAGNFNSAREPLSDKRVREALNLGVDRETLVRFDVFGNGRPIGTLSLPGEFGHNAGVGPYPYDPKRARQLLKEAGYPKGLRLRALLKANAQRTGRILAKQWAELGIHVDFTVFTDADINRYFPGERDRFDMAIYDCPDPMYHAFFIRSIFLSGESPFSLSRDAGIDERFGKLVAALDPGEQRRVSEDLDRYVHDEFLALPTYERIRTYGLRRGVTFEPATSGMSYFFEATKEIANEKETEGHAP